MIRYCNNCTECTLISNSHDPYLQAIENPSNKRSPSDFLKSVLGRPVRVKLNSGIEYRGILACLDGYMNIAMEQTEEYLDGKLQGKYGDCFLRGNNGKLAYLLVSARGV